MRNSTFFKCLILLVITVAGCNKINDTPYPLLVYSWTGAPTTTSIVIKFKTPGESESQVFLHQRKDKKDTIASSGIIETKKRDYFTAGAHFDSLKPGQEYFYTVKIKDHKSTFGKFRTLPDGPASFKFAFGSCSRTGSDNKIFDVINNKDPLFFMNIGDFHYENISRNCEDHFATAYFRNLKSHYQQKLYSSRPFIYMWDDHDYAANNSAADAPCKKDAIEAYRRFVPHYPLAFDGKTDPISQSFVVGRVKFILTDLRSQKVRPEYNGCEKVEKGTNFGDEDHLKWFLEEMLAAKDSGQVVAWVNAIPWISDKRSPKYECAENDDWGGFEEERNYIANFIKENQIPVFILSGDAHMLAIDDGSNSDYATGGGAPIPIFHAAPIDQVGILKGGPYSHGFSRKWGQFGMVEIKDDGSNKICITFSGMDSYGRTARNTTGGRIHYSFCQNL